MKKTKQFEASRGGSALIMTIVLTVLLAVVAVMFVAVARMDRASTSNIADNKTLYLAAESIVEIISKELVNDTPGVANQEYYDYPDVNNTWLASIEPYWQNPPDPNTYKWRQISDVNNFLKISGFKVNDVNVVPFGLLSTKVVHDYPIYLDTNGKLEKQSADADGDGIADSWWFELKDLHSSKGKAIYAAVRVIDNSGMVNINTAHSFNPDSTDITKIDGTSQMQINLDGLLKGETISTLHNVRCGSASKNWQSYEPNVIWDYNSVPSGKYRPFDISDELELRYRYCIDSKFMSRFEKEMPQTAEGAGTRNFGNLYDTTTSGGFHWGLEEWEKLITEPNNTYADRRHMLTTVNFDRVIDPCGVKMINLNTADVNSLYASIRRGILDANSSFPDANKVSAQIAANIIDYRDKDPNVTVLKVAGKDYYGFERPCAYISELVCKRNSDPCDANTSYAIELFKPYFEDSDPCDSWKVDIAGAVSATVTLNNDWVTKGGRYYVIAWTNSAVPLDINTNTPTYEQGSPAGEIFTGGDTISLTRDVNGVDIVVDSFKIPDTWPPAAADSNGSHCLRRDITLHKCIMRLWDSNDSNSITLGKFNTYASGDANMIQAHPADSPFTNVGQIGMVFRKGAYYKSGEPNTNTIGYSAANKLESGVRLNLADPNYQQIFKYLTVMDPRNHISSTTETRIKGRININTAPAKVIAQLPWVSQRQGSYNDPNLAKAIVAYRDKMKNQGINDPNYKDRPGAAGFENIGQLMNITDSTVRNYNIDYYATDGNDLKYRPDLTQEDGAPDDFEERDLIFARISDLVTVRSDVFTAYILVRVCTGVNDKNEVQGPQKRYMVIFDRSETTPANRKVKITAFQAVPEAR
jgi:hypothetical protein